MTSTQNLQPTLLPAERDLIAARIECPCGWHYIGNLPGFCADEDALAKRT